MKVCGVEIKKGMNVTVKVSNNYYLFGDTIKGTISKIDDDYEIIRIKGHDIDIDDIVEIA